MATIFDQENLTTSHQTTAANKPLNQSIRSLQPKTPGNNLKTPFRGRNDENTFINVGKSAKNTLVTPGPAPRTAARAPLGAKTTNAKAQAFQTPAPGAKANKSDQTAKKASSTRRTTKKRIYVETEQPIQSEIQEPEQDEPDFGYAPPPIIPLPDVPMEFDHDQTYAALRPENFNQGVGEIYFQSPKDENGFSISLKKMEKQYEESLQRDLDKILEESTRTTVSIPDFEEDIPVQAAVKQRPVASRTHSRIQESNINTIKSRSAAAVLSQTQAPRTHIKSHSRLPSVVTAQTTASKQKRKSTFAIPRDTDLSAQSIPRPPMQNVTIGFPKARKAPSILPRSQNTSSYSHGRSKSRGSISSSKEEQDIDEAVVSPRKFVQLHGEPAPESDIWLRLKELEIRDRRRDGEESLDEQPIFDFDDEELDQKLSLGFGADDEDFELIMD